MTITIIGLGPGDTELITRQAWKKLQSCDALYLRTRHHPAAGCLPALSSLESFDDLYESANSFEELYQEIASIIVAKGQGAGEVVYAVPGHPLVGESTVTAVLDLARQEGIDVNIIPGMSFIEPMLTALEIDALDGLQVFDAVQIAGFLQPPINVDIPLILGQVYSRFIAGDLKLALTALYPEDHEVVLVHGAGISEQQFERRALHEFDQSEKISYLTSMFVPPLETAGSVQSFSETVAFLRSPDGCPWDQEQDSQSLREDFLEELYEAVEAIDQQNMEAVREELGDVLYHIVMQAQIATELEEFTLTDVISGINSKLIRRHPHIWGDKVVTNSSEVLENWENLKKQEKSTGGTCSSILTGIPLALPALARAQQIQIRVNSVGFDWPDIDGVLTKIDEEMAELHQESESSRKYEEFGDVLFAMVNLARWLDIPAEAALREANSRFETRFKVLEELARKRNVVLTNLGIVEMDQLWSEAKTVVETRI